jgi:hypothetical protein
MFEIMYVLTFIVKILSIITIFAFAVLIFSMLLKKNKLLKIQIDELEKTRNNRNNKVQ